MSTYRHGKIYRKVHTGWSGIQESSYSLEQDREIKKEILPCMCIFTIALCLLLSDKQQETVKVLITLEVKISIREWDFVKCTRIHACLYTRIYCLNRTSDGHILCDINMNLFCPSVPCFIKGSNSPTLTIINYYVQGVAGYLLVCTLVSGMP